jgi:hypothetical protein
MPGVRQTIQDTLQSLRDFKSPDFAINKPADILIGLFFVAKSDFVSMMSGINNETI